jgi:hypothetical protein
MFQNAPEGSPGMVENHWPVWHGIHASTYSPGTIYMVSTLLTWPWAEFIADNYEGFEQTVSNRLFRWIER